jgi:hypothetical protein
MEETLKTSPTLYSSNYDPATGKTSYTATANPTYNPISFLSSENGAKTVEKGLTKLNEISPATAPGYVAPKEEKKPAVETPTKQPKAYFTNDQGQEAEFTQDQLNDPANTEFLKNNGYVQTKTEFNTNVGTANDKQTALDETNSKIDSLANDFLNYNVDTDPEFQSQVQNIKGQYQKLKDQMAKTNASRTAAMSSLNLRGGTTEFTGGVSMGIEGEELNQANSRIAELNRQESDAISASRKAYKDGKWTEYSNKVNALDKIRTNKAEELTTYNEKLAAITKNLNETERQSTRDNAISSLMQQGITDPATMLDYLNFDDSGKKIGDFTAKEVAETLKNLSSSTGLTVDKLTGEAKNFVVLSGIPGMLPPSITNLPKEQQLGAYLKWEKDMTTSKTVSDAGYSNDLAGLKQFSAESIALSAIPSTLRNSDIELKRYLEGIRLGLKQGMSPYEIADNLMGYQIENPDSFSDGMRPYLSLANMNGQEIANTARLINGGQKSSAIAMMENKILENQKKIDPESYVGEATPRYYAEKVAQIKKTIVDAGLLDAIGPLEGNINNIFGLIPGGKRREAAKIQSQVTSLVAEMRNHLSGTAVTAEEKKFLEPLIASMDDKKGIFLNKLDEIASNSLTRYNQTRQAGGLPILDQNQLINRSARVGLYEGGITDPNNEIDQEAEAEKTLSTYVQNNPTKATEIEKLITEMEETLNRPINASEFYQAYPNYK